VHSWLQISAGAKSRLEKLKCQDGFAKAFTIIGMETRKYTSETMWTTPP